MRRIRIVASLLALFFSAPVFGAVINVDFQGPLPATGYPGSTGTTYTGQGALATTGSTWNVVDGIIPAGAPYTSTQVKLQETTPTFVDSQGNGTSVTAVVQWRRDRVTTSTSTSWRNDLMRDAYFIASAGEVVEDPNTGSFNGPVSGIITLSNLNPTSTYNLYLYTKTNSTSSSSRAGATFTIFPGTGSASSQDATGTPTTGPIPYQLGLNYVVFSNITPDGSNSIPFQTTVRSGMTQASFSALQLEELPLAIPEPSALALAALGLAGLAVLTWRRREGLSRTALAAGDG